MEDAYRGLLEDMAVHPEDYSMAQMRRCMGERTGEDQIANPDSPLGRFLAAGYVMEPEILVQEGIIPDISFRFVPLMRHRMVSVQYAPERYREILFLGEPGSGKTALLSGIISYLYDDAHGFLRNTMDGELVDKSAENCLELIHGLRDHYFPARADKPYVRYNLVDIRRKRAGWSFVDLRARDIVKLTEFSSTAHGLASIDPKLENSNSKTLFFIVDTEAWLKEEEKGIVDEQDLFLVKAMTVLSNDGPDASRPAKGCTFSRVSDVAIILTKADRWEGRIPSGKNRDTFLLEMLNRYMMPFINGLTAICRRYGVNKSIKGNLFIFPYSLGKLKVGNLVQYNPEDSKRIAGFLMGGGQ